MTDTRNITDFWACFDPEFADRMRKQEKEEEAEEGKMDADVVVDGVGDGEDDEITSMITHTDGAGGEEGIDETGPPPRQSSTHRNIWYDVSDVMYEWTQRLLDTEVQVSRTRDFHQLVTESLERQKLDGFLSDREVADLHFIAGLWTDLSQTFSCYTLGCDVQKRRLISIVLELYTLKQINRKLFLDICLTL